MDRHVFRPQDGGNLWPGGWHPVFECRGRERIWASQAGWRPLHKVMRSPAN